MDIRMVIATNARALRLAKGLTQAQVAQRLGVDRAHVSALEMGQRNPTAVSLSEIAQALEATVSDLVVDPPRDWSQSS
jgi:transcriptional regulator with XRE-family HTH domain